MISDDNNDNKWINVNINVKQFVNFCLTSFKNKILDKGLISTPLKSTHPAANVVDPSVWLLKYDIYG